MSRVRSSLARRLCLLPLLALMWPAAAPTQDRIGSPPVEPSSAVTVAAKLLITEVSILGNDQEFVEIANPNAVDVDLSNYYLTDAIHAPENQFYWRIAEGNPTQLTVGGGAFNDFHARFPAGYVLAAGDTIVVSIAGSQPFFGHFGFYPHLELHGTGPAPRMRPVFGDIDGANSIVGTTTPTLTNTSESVILYHWDGASDLVTDIDIFFWGSSVNTRFSKTGVTVGSSTYQNETAVASQLPYLTAPTFGNSYHRIDPNEAGQPGPPGNGVGGRDEVGEPFPSTFTIAPYAPSRPPVGGPPQILSATVQNAIAGETITLRARVQAGDDPLTGVAAFFSVNGGAESSQAASDVGEGFWEAALGQHAAGTQIAWRLVATAVGGAQAQWPEGGGTLSFTVIAPPEPGEARKLLITEVSILGNDQEYVEIVNPNAEAVDLSNYYLTDAVHAPGNQYYWRIAEGSPAQDTVGGGAFNDFHARFPDGYMLAAGDTVVVSIAGSQPFFGHFGFYPHLELHGTGPAPRMRPVFGDIDGANSIVGATTPTLTNTSECVVLYFWDGTSNLVTDIDIFFWGDNVNVRFSKTGVTVGGETYQNETAVGSQQPYLTAPTFGNSYHRIDPNETGQPGPPGNGVGGRDEVGEPFPSTFTIAPYAPARPSVGGPPQVLSAVVLNPYSDDELTVRARIQAGDQPITAVTVYYRVDGGTELSQEATSVGEGFWEAALGEYPAGTVIAWRLVVADQAGGETLWPAGGGTQSVTVTDPPEPGEAMKLLITEVSILGNDQEFVEIVNPNPVAVDLSDYYLTDAIHAPGNQFYWRIAEGNPAQTTVGGGAFNDFHARFPDGYMLAAGDTVVVSIAGSQAFYGHFGFFPHIELYGTGPAPRMRPVFGNIDGANSIVGETTPTLTNTSECVVLYFWDGVSNLVTDIDVFFWGNNVNTRFSKTGVTVGGETYQNETAVANQTPFLEVPSFGFSYHRIDPNETGQPGPPGNGVAGRDEVGEPFTSTFEIRAYSPARPGSGSDPTGEIELRVPPQTFLPDLENFVFEFFTKAGYETKVRILDLAGRHVITLHDSRFDGVAPYRQLIWDGRDATFQRVRAGMYVIHLQAVERSTGKRTTKTAPVVVATRLK